MLIWDIIRDWFVMNIWGGSTSEAYDYYASVGRVFIQGEGTEVSNTHDIMVPVNLFNGVYSTDVKYISLGDWLSTMSTILVLVAVCVGLYFLTRYFFRMFAGLLSGR